MKAIKKKAVYIIPPVVVLTILFACYAVNGLFPFGDGTVAWCDMAQQVVPLLDDWKDILSGNASLFFNSQNAGGMSMLGVAGFFLTSPYALLVAFVDKADMMYFVNIMLVMKLMTAAFTSALYFRRCQSQLSGCFVIPLSVAYAFSGYVMLFYQNIMWLDIMYMFPLLLISLKAMEERRRVMPYAVIMAVMVLLNFYISYMVVIFLLIYMTVFSLFHKGEEKYSRLPVDFIIGSALALLLSAVVWLPCLMEYSSSGRKESVIYSLQNSGFLTDYQTTLEVILGTSAVFAVTIFCMLDARHRSKRLNTGLCMLLFTFIPLIINPCNLLWHTGSYMSFPARYGFITVFVGLCCTGMFLSDKRRRAKKHRMCDSVLCAAFCLCLLIVYLVYSLVFVDNNYNELTTYVHRLGNDRESFAWLLQLAIIGGAISTAIYLAYRKGFCSRQVFSVVLTLLVCTQAFSGLDIFAASADDAVPDRVSDYADVCDLEEKINDDDFYRVTTNGLLFDVNLVGAAGYNSISHYTSLTGRDYIYMMKKLGYSSYWMEVGSYGGTALTDALMSVKYKIGDSSILDKSLYSNQRYEILPADLFLPLGVATTADLSDCADIDNL